MQKSFSVLISLLLLANIGLSQNLTDSEFSPEHLPFFEKKTNAPRVPLTNSDTAQDYLHKLHQFFSDYLCDELNIKENAELRIWHYYADDTNQWLFRGLPACYRPTEKLIGLEGYFVHKIYKERDPIILALILAHELGHHIAHSLNIKDQQRTSERHADCFAGALMYELLENQELQDILKAHIHDFYHHLGDSKTHGKAIQRIQHFFDGYELGIPRCLSDLKN